MTARQHSHSFRYLAFFAGVSCIALGVALTTKANLGTTAISSLPYVASLGLPPSLGVFTIVMNVALVAIQVLLLRRSFPRLQFMQIPVSCAFGFFIDVWMAIVPDMPDGAGYAHKLLYLGAGTIVLAFGVFVEVAADVLIMAGEGVVVALTLVLGKDFGVMKTVSDSTMVLLAALLSLAMFGDIRGLREGTVVSAVAVGFIVKGFFALWRAVRAPKP